MMEIKYNIETFKKYLENIKKDNNNINDYNICGICIK